jgi:DNA-directed RNA polymerase subunit RPC12/RpoP
MLDWIPLVLLAAAVVVGYLLFSELQLWLRRCENCGRRATIEKVDERVMGVFLRQKPYDDEGYSPGETVTYEKLAIRYRCGSCGHEWEVLDVRQI